MWDKRGNELATGMIVNHRRRLGIMAFVGIPLDAIVAVAHLFGFVWSER
jgi:hypothetical protein